MIKSVQIAKQTIHLWAANLHCDNTQLISHYALLSDDERARAERFCFLEHRQAFITARAQLRQILSLYLHVPAQEIEFVYSPQKKPSLSNANDCGIQFNLTHSQGRAYIAIAYQQAVGIDTEYVKQKKIAPLINRYFSKEEQVYMTDLPLAARLNAFYRIWVGKEALLKGMGMGLRYPLNSFSIPAIDDQFKLKLEHQEWYMSLLQLEPHYPLALASDHAITNISCWQWQNAAIEQIKNIRFTI